MVDSMINAESIIFLPDWSLNHSHHWYGLTLRGRVTHICVYRLTIIGSDNGLSPGRRQAIIWTNAGILLMINLKNKLQWNLVWNSYIFIQGNAFEYVICEMVEILPRPQYVDIRHLIVEIPVCMHILANTSFVRWWNVLLMGAHLDAVLSQWGRPKWQQLYRRHWHWQQRQPLIAQPAKIAITRCMSSIRCIVSLMQRCLHCH